MTPKSEPTMTEDRALELAAMLFARWGRNDAFTVNLTEVREAAAVLQSLRERLERERAFVEAAKAFAEYRAKWSAMTTNPSRVECEALWLDSRKVSAEFNAAYLELISPPGEHEAPDWTGQLEDET